MDLPGTRAAPGIVEHRTWFLPENICHVDRGTELSHVNSFTGSDSRKKPINLKAGLSPGL